MMLARRLDKAPAAGDLGFNVRVMVQDLRTAKLTDSDAPRVAEAFRLMAPAIDRWPIAKHVIDYLPPRPEPKRLTRQYVPAKRENAIRTIDELRKKLGLPPSPYQDTSATDA